MAPTIAKATPGVFLAALVAVLAYLYYPTSSTTSTPTVRIGQGTIHGVLLDMPDFPKPIEAFRGIPYAIPPVGNLRFARPQPVADSSEVVINATQYGPRCPGKQLLVVPGAAEASENCLTANVFRPAGQHGKLPVAVYFHGGAFNRGTAKMHNTASMVAHAEPFIGVSFNYRIGALGFLNSAMTAKEGLLNLGLRDQVVMLEWVQKNIAAFGGNPKDVTIIGLSAGAHSIGHHLLNRKSIFHKAVMESGGPTSRALHPPDAKLHEDQFAQFLKELKCKDLACLRKAPEAAVVAASNSVFDTYNPSVRWAWQPVIDGDLIPGRTLEQSWPSDIPILTGFVHNEGTMYVPRGMSKASEFDAFFRTLLPHVTEAPAPFYPESDHVEWRQEFGAGAQYRRIEAAYGQYAYICPVRQTAQIAKSPVYLYHWNLNKTIIGGANHGDQMWYEGMDVETRAISPTQEELAKTFHGYITTFIRTGDPNGGGRPKWVAWGEQERSTAGTGKTMIFGAGNDERVGGTSVGEVAALKVDDWGRDQCEKLWWKWSDKYED